MQELLVEQSGPAVEKLDTVNLFGEDKDGRKDQVEHVIDVAPLANRDRDEQVVGENGQHRTKQDAPHQLIHRDFFDVAVRMPEADRQTESIGVDHPQVDVAQGIRCQ